jgi:hypothetical protein
LNKRLKIAALALPLVIWLAAPLLARYPLWFYESFADACAKTKQTASSSETPAPTASAAEISDSCATLIARNGQSGDLYGVTSSLFSGLALFAVAYALWSDLAFRRRERRPMITCTLTDTQSLSFYKPILDATPKLFCLKGQITAASISEAAINIQITPVFIVGNQLFKLKTIHVGLPLPGGQATPVSLSYVLQEELIDCICKSSTGLPQMQLKLLTECTNLDGEKFVSSVTYGLSLVFPDFATKILSVRHSGHAFDNAWSDEAAVDLQLTLEPGSWSFSDAQRVESTT